MATTATEEAVRTAADALILEKIEPTPDTVRRRIGGGSFSTIARILKGWKAERAERLQMTIDIPAEVDAQAQALVQNVWTTAVMDARKQVDAARQAAESQVQRIAAELAEATAEIRRLEDDALTDGRKLKELNSELQKRDVRLAVVEAEADRLKTELATLRAQLDDAQAELFRKAEQVGRQDGELEALRRQLRSPQDQPSGRGRK
jgi:chromosome segregation ATPase